MRAYEINFDGLIGPTHNFAGLSYGNLASQRHGHTVSNPREAALQGLAKMKFMADLGLKQAVLPPLDRPDLNTLRRLGFSGSEWQIVRDAARQSPLLLASCYSASAMWAANAATVSPSADTQDGRVHFTPANLVSQFHRSLEAQSTAAMLRTIFADSRHFTHHPPLPANGSLGDEGAANHTRLAASHGQAGIEVFVYGRPGFAPASDIPTHFPARQALEASESIARLHGLVSAKTLFVRQHPAAINAGAFHNDVVAVGNENVLLYHQSAFENGIAGSLCEAFAHVADVEPFLIEVPGSELSLEDAVATYLFNSQLVTLPAGGMALICPTECRESPRSHDLLERLIAENNPIRHVHFVDVRQSMKNGGGPACLRLRVVLTETELAATAPGVFLTDALYGALAECIRRRYRDRLTLDDLADPQLIEESRSTLRELRGLLGLASL